MKNKRIDFKWYDMFDAYKKIKALINGDRKFYFICGLSVVITKAETIEFLIKDNSTLTHENTELKNKLSKFLNPM